jgi:hypothetical protein
MAAVIAAIGAAFLAGAVALFREHRLQQRQLLVAARVMHATFKVASQSIKTTLETNGWALFNAVPGETSFPTAWETYKGGLAGHLTWDEWVRVERAVTAYLALRTMSQKKSPGEVEDVLAKVRIRLDGGKEVLHAYCTTRLSVWRLVRRRVKGLRSRGE